MLTLFLLQKKGSNPFAVILWNSQKEKTKRFGHIPLQIKKKKNDISTSCWLALLDAARQTSYIMCQSDRSDRTPCTVRVIQETTPLLRLRTADALFLLLKLNFNSQP